MSFYFVPLDSSALPFIIRSMVFNVSYEWYQDFVQSRTFSLVATTLQFNLTDNFGLSLKYQYGKISTPPVKT